MPSPCWAGAAMAGSSNTRLGIRAFEVKVFAGEYKYLALMGDIRVATTNISKAQEKRFKGVRAVLNNILLTELIGFILSLTRYRSTRGYLGSKPVSARSPPEHK